MAAAAAGLVPIGARAIFAGVDDFLTQLTRIGTQLGDFGGANGPLGQVNDRLATVSGGFARFNAAIATTQLAVGTAGATVSTLTAPLRAVGGAVTSAAGEVVEGSGKIVGALGDITNATTGLSEKGLLGVAGVGTALVGLAATAITESARYERGMKDIQAVTQVNVEQLGTLDETIRRVAARFPSAIGDIQAAARELGKAGVDVNSLTSNILQLALALQNLSSGELTSTGAAEAIGSNMALFRRSFTDAGNDAEQQSQRIANAITGIANATRASIPEVISAINKLGPNLVPLGGTIEQTAALAGIVLKQGPRGQEAGTALANLIQRAEAPSKEASKILEQRNLSLFTAEGKPRPAIDFIKDIQDTYGRAGRAVNGLTEAQAANELAEIAQTRVLRTLNLILETGVDDYKEFLDVIGRTDVLAQAAIQNQSLIRQLEILRNNAQLAGIAFGEDFVRGLGSATTALNTFLQNSDLPRDLGGLLGRGTAALLTGNQAQVADVRAGANDAPFFGPDTLPTFDAIFGAGEKIRGNILDLTRDAANFGKTLGLIAFPGGVPEAIDGVGETISTLIRIADEVIKKFDELAPQVVKDLQEITGASSFEELLTNARTFGKEIQEIFTGNGGEQSFKNLTDEATNFFKIVREEGKPTIESLARLARTIEDTAPAFLRAGETAVRVLATITRSASELLAVLLRLTSFNIGVTGGLFNFLGTGFNQGRGGLSGNFTTVSAAEDAARRSLARQGSDRAASGLGSGGLTTGSVVPLTAAQAGLGVGGLAGAPTPNRPEMTFEDIERINQANADAEQAADDAAVALDGEATAAANAGNEVGLTQGEFDNLARKQKEAEAAAKALEAAQKSLSAQMRTLDKDVVDAGGSFDKTIAGAQQRWLDGLDQIAESTADAVARIRRTASEARTKALEGFNLNVERTGGFAASLDEEGNLQLAEEFVEGTNTIFRHGQEDRKRDFSQGIEDRQRLRQQFDENDSTAAARHNEELTRLEQQAQEGITRERQIGIEDRERQRQRAEERETLLFTRAQERSLTAFTQGQSAANTARLRAREDQRASQRLAEDLAKATTPEERTKLLTSFTEGRKTTAQQRADQDEDTKFAQQQQVDLTSFRQAQEDALTKKRQDLEDQNIAHRRELEVSDITFRRQLEVDMIIFRRDLEDRETNRRRAAAALEISQRRKDELEALGFDRTQQQEAQLNTLTTETIPNLQRQLTQINQQETDQIQNTAENTAKQLLRAGLTFRREIQAAGVTEVEQLRRLQERFEAQVPGLLERVPEARRGELQAQIDTQRQVLAAQIVTAQARQAGRGGAVANEVDQVTQDLINRLGLLAPGADLNSIQNIFGQQATANLVTTSLLAAPQVDRLTRALEGLTTKIDQIAPGVHVDTVEQTIQQPTTPQGAIIQIGTIGGAV